MSDIVKCCWSGGKDSSCALMLHLFRGDVVKAVCYVPMFTNEIPLILPDHLEFLNSTADRFRDLGASVDFVHGITYYDFVLKRSSRGKFKGRIFGFPPFIPGRCGFQLYSKTRSLNSFDVGVYDYVDIGIASDEVNRLGQLSDSKRSILVELGIDTPGVWDFDRRYSLISPVYVSDSRDGCALCPHGSADRRKRWFAAYPEAVPLVLELQDIVKRERPGLYPLRGHQFFL